MFEWHNAFYLLCDVIIAHVRVGGNIISVLRCNYCTCVNVILHYLCFVMQLLHMFEWVVTLYLFCGVGLIIAHV